MMALRGTVFAMDTVPIGCPSPACGLRMNGPMVLKRQRTIGCSVRGQRVKASVAGPASPGPLSVNAARGVLGAASFFMLPIGAAFADGIHSGPGADLSAFGDDPGRMGTAVIFGLLGLKLAAMVQSQVVSVRGLSAGQLVEVMGAGSQTLVLDIRTKAAARQEGRPDWGQYGKMSVSVPYLQPKKTGASPDARFAEKVGKLRGLNQRTVLVLVDSNGRQAPAAARQIQRLLGGRRVVYLKGGTDRWKTSGLPWKAPRTSPKLPEIKVPDVKINLPSPPSLGVGDLTELYRKHPGVYNSGLALGAAALSVALVFRELDILLESVGLAVAAQLLGRRLFFAKDRNETLRQLRELRDEKIAVGEAGKDFKRLANSVLSSRKRPKSKTSAPATVDIGSNVEGVGSGTPVLASEA